MSGILTPTAILRVGSAPVCIPVRVHYGGFCIRLGIMFPVSNINNYTNNLIVSVKITTPSPGKAQRRGAIWVVGAYIALSSPFMSALQDSASDGSVQLYPAAGVRPRKGVAALYNPTYRLGLCSDYFIRRRGAWYPLPDLQAPDAQEPTSLRLHYPACPSTPIFYFFILPYPLRKSNRPARFIYPSKCGD
jgi:hypothetical protein